MKKYLILILVAALSSSYVGAKDLSKEDKKRINDQLKEYKKNPESFQRMLDKHRQDMDSAEAQLSAKNIALREATTSLADTKNKMTSLEAELKSCQSKPVQTCPPCPQPGAVPTGGTVYKIQLGLFRNSDLGSFLTDPKYFGVEHVGDKNRYVISYFNDKEDAEKFVAELKKMGIKGAFAAKYDGGERVVETKKAAPAIKKAPKKK